MAELTVECPWLAASVSTLSRITFVGLISVGDDIKYFVLTDTNCGKSTFW